MVLGYRLTKGLITLYLRLCLHQDKGTKALNCQVVQNLPISDVTIIRITPEPSCLTKIVAWRNKQLNTSSMVLLFQGEGSSAAVTEQTEVST